MKVGITVVLSLVLALITPPALGGGVRVKGYFKRDGTYVAPHYRSAPNSSKYDNYSTRGNFNPYTGEAGRTNPDSSGALPAPVSAYRQPVYTLPSYTPATYAAPRTLAPSVAATGVAQSAGLLPGYDAALERSLPSQQPSATARTAAEDRAMAEVSALGARYRATDGMFEAKLSALQPQIRQIQASLPPEQWAPAIEIAWANLSKQIAAQAVRPPAQLYGRTECQVAADKAEDLAYEARNLERCASRGDLSDDCSREARGARAAAEDYESAVAELGGSCN